MPLAVVAFLATAALAQAGASVPLVWVDDLVGDFDDPTNWSTSMVPGTSDVIQFGIAPGTTDATLVIRPNGSHQVQSLEVYSGDAVFSDEFRGPGQVITTDVLYIAPGASVIAQSADLHVLSAATIQGSLYLEGVVFESTESPLLVVPGVVYVNAHSQWNHSGTVTFDPTATLRVGIDASAPSHGALVALASVNTGGTLEIVGTGVPTPDQKFRIIEGFAVNNTFDTTMQIGFPDRVAKFYYNAQSLDVAFNSSQPGDADGDLDVDLDDLQIVLFNFASDAAAGDFNADGIVDLDDLQVLLFWFGS
ncbi:MAG: hypothetical protein KDA20_03630 [Phycisphaerales bacterium]|nr:hypothetical protein [Phycisphaerales bacterium]